MELVCRIFFQKFSKFWSVFDGFSLRKFFKFSFDIQMSLQNNIFSIKESDMGGSSPLPLPKKEEIEEGKERKEEEKKEGRKGKGRDSHMPKFFSRRICYEV